MPDHTPLERKAEAALVAYLQSILTALDLDDLQVLPAYQDAAALATPRVVVSAQNFTPRSVALTGVMDGQLEVALISQTDDLTAAEHQTKAASILSWLLDLEVVRAALNTAADFHCYLYQFHSAPFVTDAGDGTHTTTMTFNVIAQGMDG